MSKRKLREWEIPMNLSDEERKMFNMTTRDQLNWSAKVVDKDMEKRYPQLSKYVLRIKDLFNEGYETVWSGDDLNEGKKIRTSSIALWGSDNVELILNEGEVVINE